LKTRRLILYVGVILGLIVPLLGVGVASATPSSWNDPNYKLVWERTDKPVQDGVTARSWMWGPDTVPGSPASEPYAEAPGGNRVVQYFDKSRMEVNDPSADRSQLWFVTNGLLVKEMVSGQLQVGNSTFQPKGSSTEAVAGDPASTGNTNCPTYATFKDIASLNNDHASAPKSGFVNEAIDKTGAVTTWVNPSPSPDPSVAYAYFDGTLKHNIPNKFWDFMNQTGPVYWNGAMSNDTVCNWVFAMGLPITEPYWTKAKVAGVEKDVLVQLFERRVLTYTPSNPAGFQVEMGNVGQHYYRWRYTTGSVTEERIAFASDRSGNFDIWSMKTTGGDVKRLTTDPGADIWATWSPDNSKIAFMSNRDGNFEIYVMNADGSNQTRLTNDAANPDQYPTWTPDGSVIGWTKGTQTWVMTATGGNQHQLGGGPASNEFALTSPDGQSLVWASNTTGSFEVWKARFDGVGGFVQLTFDAASDDYPMDWHGHKILYLRTSGGIATTWSMDDDGGNKLQIATDSTRATYSPDGSKIVLQKGTQIYVMNADGTSAQNITNTGGNELYPDWSN
jgi:hypothetical protein